MPDAFQVDPGLLRSAAGSVEECCRQVESWRKSGAAARVHIGMAGFAVAGGCAPWEGAATQVRQLLRG